ncbi:MAG: hypothetical protein AAF218_07975 [Pseudomonadota bacterium]
MTRPPHDFSDADLTAFLDGAAPEELSKEIEAAVAEDHTLAQRLAQLDVPMDVLTAAMETLAQTAPAPPHLPAAAPPRRRSLWPAASFAAGLAAGLAIALFTAADAPPAPGWKAVVASYHSLYGPDTLTAETADAELTAQLTRASAALGRDLVDLPAADGLALRRAQILDFNGKTLVQLAFLRADGTPVALCIIKSSPDNTAATSETLQGMAATSWRANGFAYLLIGGEDPATLPTDTYQAWSSTL